VSPDDIDTSLAVDPALLVEYSTVMLVCDDIAAEVDVNPKLNDPAVADPVAVDPSIGIEKKAPLLGESKPAET
jgi:hypothetical protein